MTDKQRIDELERAVFLLAREQEGQSGSKVWPIIKRYAPKQESEQKIGVPA